jgi:hypothetical protein
MFMGRTKNRFCAFLSLFRSIPAELRLGSAGACRYTTAT